MLPHLYLVSTGERHHTNAVLLLVHHRGSDSQLLRTKPGALQAGKSLRHRSPLASCLQLEYPCFFRQSLLQVLSFQAKESEGGCILCLALVSAATPNLSSTTKVVTSPTYSPSMGC